MKRPGVMIYFSLRPALSFLDDQQQGQLLRAILDYAEYGEVPDFQDPLLTMAWSFIAPCVDRDWKAYNERVEKNRYAVYCREVMRREMNVPTFETWAEMTEVERKQYLDGVISSDGNN